MITVNKIKFNASIIGPEYLTTQKNIYIKPEDVRVITGEDEYVDLILKDGMVIQFCFEDDEYTGGLIELFFYNNEFRRIDF